MFSLSFLFTQIIKRKYRMVINYLVNFQKLKRMTESARNLGRSKSRVYSVPIAVIAAYIGIDYTKRGDKNASKGQA